MTTTLFPDVAEHPAAAPKTAASEGRQPEPVAAGRGLDLRAQRSRQALVRQKTDPDGRAPWFDWSANPYRGCEFGCGYCYARYAHGYLGHDDPQDFERTIYVKQGFVEALRRDLRRVAPGAHIAFGTATDPYQPLEKREQVMPRVLRELARVEGLRISITTKSTLVGRDADLLARLATRHAVQVNLTITTPDARLARFLEPKAPDPKQRFRILARLRRRGVEAGVFLMPLLPGITDMDADLDRLMSRAADAGAQWLCSSVVFLREPTRGHFLRQLRVAYPRVAARYEWWTRTNCRLPEKTRADVLGRVRSLAVRHGLSAHADPSPPPVTLPRQATFEFANGAPE